MPRRLAAILVADVVSYAALVAEDEDGALATLRRLRAELFGPAISGWRGRLVRSVGDGWLVEFRSAADAVNCAIALQTGLATEPKVRVRIGVHVGDVSDDGDDLFGDGVNVAARLEALAEPGAAAISDAVYGSLDGTLTASFDDAGEHVLKNIPRVVRVWLRPDQSAPAGPGAAFGGDRDHPDSWPVVAIRPISTNDPRAEARDLAAGLTGDLRNYLDQSRWLAAAVTSRPTRRGYVLASTLRVHGERVRLEARLTKGDDELIWSHRADGDLAESFDWQDRIGADIAARAMNVMLDREMRKLAKTADDERDAEASLLAAILTPLTVGSADDVAAKHDHLTRAIALHPNWGAPYAHGAMWLLGLILLGVRHRPPGCIQDMSAWVSRATELSAPGSPQGFVAASARHWLQPDADRLRVERRAALRLSPFHQDVLAASCQSALLLGEPEEAIEFAERALTFTSDTRSAVIQNHVKATAFVMLGRYDEALELSSEVIAATGDLGAAYYVRASALAHVDDLSGARDALKRALSLAPDVSISDLRRRLRFAETPEVLRFYDGLAMAGMEKG